MISKEKRSCPAQKNIDFAGAAFRFFCDVVVKRFCSTGVGEAHGLKIGLNNVLCGNIALDEIQEVERWQIAINSLRVDFACDIYLTGSNSKLLSGELATYLSGRYIQIQVFPFSLAEAKQQCIENGTYTSDEKLFADYLKYGGFPQRFFLPDDHSITTYLDDLYEAIIVRDIMLRHNIREQTALRNVLAFLLDNIGNPFSARNISGRSMMSRTMIAS